MAITFEEVSNLLSYHSMSQGQLDRSALLRIAAKNFAFVLIEHTQPSADQSAALRHIREALFTANAAIALEKV